MITDAERAQLQDDLAGLYPDKCTIVQREQGAFNPSTGLHDVPVDTEVYSGDCRVMPWPGTSRQAVTGEEAVTIRSYWLTVPLEAENVLPDHICIVTASADPDLLGRELAITDASASSLAAERRLVAQDVEGWGEEGS